MKISTIIAGLFAAVFSVSAAGAASVDLEARGLVQGGLIASSNAVSIFYDADIDLFDAEVDDGVSLGFFSVFPSDPSSAFLDIVAPVAFAGGVEAFDLDAVSAAGLFLDVVTATRVYAVLTLPANVMFDFSAPTFTIAGATVEVYAVAPIPLPAALPLALAGLGALALVGRRRRT